MMASSCDHARVSTPGLFLVWNGAAPAFQEVTPTAGKWKLGRNHPAWDPPDARMSREHCEVLHADGEWHFRDLGSVNGTRLDGSSSSEHTRHSEWSVLQVGHSLLIPHRPGPERPEVCHLDAFADRPGFAGLEEAAREAPGAADWRPELLWWVHHALHRLGEFELEVAFVSNYLLHRWRTRTQLLANISLMVSTLPPGTRRVTRDQFRPPDAPDLDSALHAVAGPRDPAIISQALVEADGDLRRAADALGITVDALHQWMRRHDLITTP